MIRSVLYLGLGVTKLLGSLLALGELVLVGGDAATLVDGLGDLSRTIWTDHLFSGNGCLSAVVEGTFGGYLLAHEALWGFVSVCGFTKGFSELGLGFQIFQLPLFLLNQGIVPFIDVVCNAWLDLPTQ